MIILAIFCVLIDYLLSIIIVGASFAAIKRAFKLNIPTVFSLIILMLVFEMTESLSDPTA